MHNVVLLCVLQLLDAVINVAVALVFRVLFPVRLLENVDSTSLCYQEDRR